MTIYYLGRPLAYGCSFLKKDRSPSKRRRIWRQPVELRRILAMFSNSQTIIYQREKRRSRTFNPLSLLSPRQLETLNGKPPKFAFEL